MATIEVQREGKWVKVIPKDLTTDELCNALMQIQIVSDEFLSPQEIAEGYDAIYEAARRLQSIK